MRGGPSTGIPTKSEQGDLNIAVYGFHGDAPHLVLAPQSVGDCLFTTQWATYLAEALQAPAIVLSDQFIGQARVAIDRPADVAFIGARARPPSSAAVTSVMRATANGVSPMAIPGIARRPIYRRRSHPHRERGNPTSGASRSPQAARQAPRQARAIRLRRPLGDDRRRTANSRSSPGVRSPAPRARRLHARADDGIKARLIAPRLLSPVQPEKLKARARTAPSASWWSSRRTAPSSTAICAPITTCPRR